MPVLIDGHNLIGRLPDVSLEDRDDEVRLVSRLQAYAGRTGKRVAVVFDRGMPGGRSDNLSSGRVEVVFAPTGRSADRVLRERIRQAPNPRGLLVVSSDREVISAALGRGARVVRSEDFVAQLEPVATRSNGAKEDPRLSPGELEDWLALFGGQDD